MDRNNENRGILNPANFRDNGNRRALMDIKNIVGAPPYPCIVTKKGLTDVNVADAKKPTFSPRWQIRKFSGSLTSKSQPFPQGIGGRHGPIGNERRKRPISTVVDSDGLDSYTAIDVDDLRPVHDHPLAKVDEMDEMVNGELKEVEMEDLVAEPFVDIDMCDIKDPLAVVDYVEDIYSFYRENEVARCVSPEYMNNQFDINNKMRAILIDWLIEVHYKFELMDETLYLTVNIIDRFLEKQAVVRKKLQLVGVTAMFLACKYEEVSVPVVEDLIQISDRAYTRQEVLEMEKLILNTLKFNMSVPTPYVFMRRYLKAAESDKKLELLSFFIIELCLVEHQTLKFRPSMLAAAAIYTAQCTIKGFKYWTSTSELYTSYSEDHLLECSRMMVEFHQKARDGKLTAAFRKYSTFKFGFAAKSEPALFLLNTRF